MLKRLLDCVAFACRHPNLAKLGKKCSQVIVACRSRIEKRLRKAMPVGERLYQLAGVDVLGASLLNRPQVARKLPASLSDGPALSTSVARCQAFKLFF